MILPNRLFQGDTIGIISPAGPVNSEDLRKGIPFFTKLGLRVQLGRHVEQIHGYFAGTDEERLADFHEMIASPHIKAIFCARGGYGTAKIVPYLDYKLIQRNPKIIWGYSDITYLHTAIRKMTGLVTFHGPMVASDIAKEDFDSLSKIMFQQLFQPTSLTYTEHISPLHIISPGKAEGVLVGGNLSVLRSTIGTPYEIDVKDKILFIEDIGEDPYKVDSMLQQLVLSGKLEEARAIIIGDFSEADTEIHSFTMEEVFRHYFSDINIPVMGGFKIGHCFPHFAVPLGVKASICTERKQLTILPGVQ